jgi:Zn-dependent peptidase ImmA (M78 family)
MERDPEQAAVIARSELGLSNDAPVKHVIATMEAAGVVVIALPRSFARGDAFSAWAFADDTRRRPVVVLSAGRPADRVRMNAAHELAHLVMHQQVAASAAALEDDAKKFASAFLMPADAMRDMIISPVTLDTFVSFKLPWGVSIQALIVRSHELGLITPRKYKSLMQRLSARGWRINEPLSSKVPLERPRVVRQMAEAVYGRRIDYARFAANAHYPECFIRDLMEAHAGKGPEEPRTSEQAVEPTKPLLRFQKH